MWIGPTSSEDTDQIHVAYQGHRVKVKVTGAIKTPLYVANFAPPVLKRNLKHIFIIRHSVLTNSICFSYFRYLPCQLF